MAALDAFHRTIRRWFKDTFSTATPVQVASWPVIAGGQHVLITAPTGSGKTLTAFLWSIDGFFSGRLETGATRVLYLSPLKALNTDIARNLLDPLDALAQQHGAPAIRVATRSGDTSSSERQRLLRRPPEILVTTPESLALMLSTRKGQQALATVQQVIVDEVHAMIDSRRGVALLTSLERLVRIAGEFQRIGLSATVHPLDVVAAELAGFSEPEVPRSIEIVNASASKAIELKVRYPEAARQAADQGVKIWEPLADAFCQHLGTNESTLFFANSRRLAEKITLKINERSEETVAYAHHGSLARALRAEVEGRLKAGELKAIVATNSLEMGIDIGALDEVVMVQSPQSIASALQRLGRAGHQVGATSRGSIYPTHAQDFLEAAVIADCVQSRDIEPAVPLRNPLDSLAQIIVSICAFEPWPVDVLFDLLRCSAPYSELPRSAFDGLIEMLAGRYEGAQLKELKPRLRYDRLAGTVEAKRGAVLALYLSGGSIPERGYYQLRHSDSGALIGELDEEFVWEATTGQTFTLGSQAWQINRITHTDVLVRPARKGSELPPFWRSERTHRSLHFSRALLRYLDRAEEALANAEEDRLERSLKDRCGFDDTATDELLRYLNAQRAALDGALPGSRRLVIEQLVSGPGGYSGPGDARQTIIHSFWGGRVNQPFALALKACWEQTQSARAELHADNNAIVLQHQGPLDIEALIAGVTPDSLLPLLKQSLEGSGFFGARFRECAGRALLLGKARFKDRLPLWLIRLQAKKLMQKVQDFEDFPILQEAWRTCLHDEFDLPVLTQLLDDLHSGAVELHHVRRKTPSPFAVNVTFDQISRYMYADDAPEGQAQTGLREDVLALALADPDERPRIEATVARRYEAKRQRRESGYEPREAEDWLDWIKERWLLPAAEAPTEPGLIDALHSREQIVVARDGERCWWLHLEQAAVAHDSGLLGSSALMNLRGEPLEPAALPRVVAPRSAIAMALDVLSFFGPQTAQEITELLPTVPAELFSQPELISGPLLADDEDERYCDSDNFEALLRFQRAERRTAFEALPITRWPEWTWLSQGGQERRQGADADEQLDHLAAIVERCRGFPGPLTLWLRDLFAARTHGFSDSDLDALFAEGTLRWIGVGREQLTLCDESEALLLANPQSGELSDNALTDCFADPAGRYSYLDLKDRTGIGADAFNDQFWEAVWAGRVSADSLAPLRQGVRQSFQPTAPRRASRRRLGSGAGRWSGNWFLLPPKRAEATNLLSALEEGKEQARLLLDRYGWLCRELVLRDHPALRWRALFRALRIMELSGEVQAGLFFEGFGGPQFARAQTLASLRHYADRLPAQDFWLAATDPAAPSGLGLRWPGVRLPARRPGSYLAFAGGELGLLVHSHGKRLQFLFEPEDERNARLLTVFDPLLKAQRQLSIETINDAPAITSPYRAVLEAGRTLGSDHRNLSLLANTA